MGDLYNSDGLADDRDRADLYVIDPLSALYNSDGLAAVRAVSSSAQASDAERDLPDELAAS